MTIWQYILETSCRLNTGMDKNLRTVSLHDSVILLGDVSQGNEVTHQWICVPMATIVLFTTWKIQDQLRCSSADK